MSISTQLTTEERDKKQHAKGDEEITTPDEHERQYRGGESMS